MLEAKMKVRNKQGVPASASTKDYLKCSAADLTEKRQLIDLCRIALYGAVAEDGFALDRIFFSLTEGSSLDHACTPLRKMLKHFVQSPSVIRIASENDINSLSDVYVTSTGGLIVPQGAYGWQELTDQVNAEPACARQLRHLAEAAKVVGGFIRLGKTTNAAQWLGFHGINTPSTVGEVIKLLSFLAWEWNDRDGLGNYWDYLVGHDADSVTLTQQDHDDIRQATLELCPRGKSLLATLYEKVRPADPGESRRECANEMIVQLLNHPFSQALAKKYIVALGWYGAGQGENLESSDLAQCLVTAILVELNAFKASVRKRNCIGAFELCDPVRFAGQPVGVIRSELESYLMTEHGLDREVVTLASHMLLAGIAPEFLVKQVPANFTLGSVGWVTFNVAVAFVEMNAKGSSRNMTFDEIMIFADMDTYSSGLGQLQSLVSIEPVIDWGLVNGVITHEQLTASYSDASAAALSAYQSFIERLSSSAKIWAAAPPDRRETAIQALQAAAPGCDFLEERILRHNTDRLGHSMKMSMLDLHIEGELTSQEWDWRKEGRLYDQYPELPWMNSNQEVFETKVREHYRQLHEALGSNIKLAIASMPAKDREVFEQSDIHFFTFRPPVAEVRAESSNVGLIGSNAPPLKPMEKQANRDAATGRFGVVLYVPIGADRYLCYEMFNLRGECRRNDKLGDYIHHYGRVKLPARMDFKGDPNKWVAAAYADKFAPVDLECYTHGTAPRAQQTSHAVMDKLGTLAAPASLPAIRHTVYQHYISAQVGRIAGFIVENRPLASIEEYIDTLTVLTEREEKRATKEKVEKFIVDLVVPFKSCIEDLASGDKERIGSGIFGCTMDAIGLISGVLGAVPKALNIAGKTASLSTKVIQALKLGLKFTGSTLNPLGDLPSLGLGLSKKILRGGLKVGKEGLQLVELATHQLAALTGKADCLELLRSATFSQIAKGKWRPRGRTIDMTDVAAISFNSHWYGVNRHGRPWGKRITFESTQVFSLPDVRGTVPTGFIHHVVDQSIPAAVRKIDNAISALTSAARKFDTDPALGLFFGSTQQGRDELLGVLWYIKADFAGLSVKNVFLNPQGDDADLIQIYPGFYRQWKNSGASQSAGHEFLRINARNLNDRLSQAGFNFGEIADDLIHEMYLCGAGHQDIAAASTAFSEKGVNVAPLLALAAGSLPIQGGPQGAIYESRMALKNADSVAMTIALLNQSVIDPPKFVENVGIMTRAVQGNKVVSSEVWVDLNTK
jgi:hypothetical protein